MKSNFSQQPYKLIDIDQQGHYHVVEQTLTLIENLSQSLAVISIAGQYRTGKSYLLNRVILNRPDGFQVGSTINSCTKGLWVWGKPLIGKTPNNQLINILVIDSEGFGSTEQQVNYDTKLFALNMLLTSCFLYNTIGAIDEGSIQNLAVIAEIVKNISSRNGGDVDSPQLLWILRDFCLQLVSDEGVSFSSKQYLERALEYTKEENRNKVRKLLMSIFRDRDCITLVRPLTQEQNLAELNKLELEDLRPEFIQQSISMRKRLLSEIKPKKYFGREVDGVLFCKMIRNYVSVINTNTIPQIENIWRYVSEECIHEATTYFQEQLDLIVRERINSKLPICDEELNKMLQSIESMLLQQLKVKINSYQGSDQCVSKCRKLVTKKSLQIHIANEGKLRSQIQKIISIQYLVIQKKITSNQLNSIQSLIFQFQKCSQSISKRMSIRSTKISQIVTSISLSKIIESSKSLIHLKNKEIDNLKYRMKEEEIKFEEELRELKGELLTSKSTSILEINKLETDRKELEMRQHNLQEIVDELKFEKVRLQESMETESRREKSMSVRTVSEMKFRIDQFNDKNEQSERRVMILRSEHQKTEALLKQKIEFQERMIDEVKQQSSKYSERAKKLKESSGQEIKELTIKLEEVSKSKLMEIMSYSERVSDLEMEVARRGEEAEEERAKRERVVSEWGFREDEWKRRVEEMEERVKEGEGKRVGYEKMVESLGKGLERIEGLERSVNEKEESIIQFKNELKLKEAILGQKVEFYEMEISELNRKYQDELGKNTALMNIIGVKEEELIQEMKMKHEENVRELENQYGFEISHLKEQLEETLGKKYLMEQEYSLKSSEMADEIEQLEGRNRALEESRNKLTESLKSIEIEKAKYLRQTQQRNSLIISSLNQDIERLKAQNTQQIRELQDKNLQMMRHLKNYYQMEKEKYQKKILEYQEKQRETPYEEYEEKILLLEARNLAYEHEIEEMREEFKEAEGVQGRVMKEYQQRVSELTVEMSVLKEQKHSYIEESSKERLRKEESYTEQIEHLQASLLACQGKLDNSYNDIIRKDKELYQLNQKREVLEGQVTKKDQLIEEYRFQVSDDSENYQKELKEITEKYYKVNEESLRYKIESEKQLALIRQQIEFNTRKITELETEKEGFQSKLVSLKSDSESEYSHLNEKYKLEVENRIETVNKLKKGYKEEEGKYLKSINTLEKEKIHLEEEYKLLELRLENISKEYNRYKEEYLASTSSNTNEYQVEILTVKGALKDIRLKYETEHSRLIQLESNYERDKLLWLNKSKFLENQRDQAKQDLNDGFKKFEQALSQINKTRTSEDSLEDITKSIERKYLLQMESLKQSYEKKGLESESTIKMLNLDLKKLKSQLTKQKDLYQTKLQQQIQLITLANNTISQQLNKQMQSREYSTDKERKEMVEKIGTLEKSLKEMGIRMDHMKVGIEKDQVKFNIEKKGLTDNIQELMANNEVLFRENQRFRNKEKLVGKKFIREY